MCKADSARALYLNPHPGNQAYLFAWVAINAIGLPLTNPRDHVFRVPADAPLSVAGRIVASGTTP